MSKTNSDVNNIKKDLLSIKEQIANACYEIEELDQYLRRDCLEISGIKATQPNPLFNQLAKLLMFQLTTKIFLLRILYRITMLLLHQK